MNAHSHTIGSHTHTFSGSSSHGHRILTFTGNEKQGISNMYSALTKHTSNSEAQKNRGVVINVSPNLYDIASGQTNYVSPSYSNSMGYTNETIRNSSVAPIIEKSTVSISGTTSSTQPTCSSTTSTGTFKGTDGTTGSNGSGTSFSILPPYIVKYCWERTA